MCNKKNKTTSKFDYKTKVFTIVLYIILISMGQACHPKQTTTAEKTAEPAAPNNATPQQNTSTNASENAATTTPISNNDYTTTSTGKRIRKAEMGVTVVNPDGWPKSDMEFHLGYCAQMFAKTPEVDPNKFCPCFLEKIQYYYEPIYFKEAYEHQQKWNTECYLEAKK